MKARDIMSKDPRAVTPDTDVREAARLMKDQDTGVLPVVEGQSSKRLVGIVTDRDIAIRVVAEGRSTAQVRDAMSGNVRSCRADDDLKDVMDVMAREQVRRVPVVDDRGELIGIVSQADLVRQGPDKKAERTIEQISQPGGAHTQ